MKFDKMKRFVSLMAHPSDKVVSFDLILICCVIASAQKHQCIESAMAKLMGCGIIRYLKRVHKRKYAENDLRALMVICALIDHGSDDEVKQIMDSEILFPFVAKIACNQIIDEYIKNCVANAIKKVLYIYKTRWNVDVWPLVVFEVERLRTNKNVLNENKLYLNSLIDRVQSQ